MRLSKAKLNSTEFTGVIFIQQTSIRAIIKISTGKAAGGDGEVEILNLPTVNRIL